MSDYQKQEAQKAMDAAPKLYPLRSIEEMADEYTTYLRNPTTSHLSLKGWLPGLHNMRDLRPGDVVIVVASTGNGKSAVLQNMAVKAFRPESVLFFEIEMGSLLTFERFAGIATGYQCRNVEEYYATGSRYCSLGTADHVFCCTESRLRLCDIEAMAKAAAEGKYKGIVGEPKAVMIDYIGLVENEKGRTLYERMTAIANELEPMAKALNMVVVIACQAHRKKDDNNVEITLHDARDSGQLEAAARLLLGVWLVPGAASQMYIAVLKDRMGPSSTRVECNFDGGSMNIEQAGSKEQAQEQADIGAEQGPF